MNEYTPIIALIVCMLCAGISAFIYATSESLPVRIFAALTTLINLGIALTIAAMIWSDP